MAAAGQRKEIPHQTTLINGRVSAQKVEGEIMLKSICKNMVWMAVPLGLAMGCAANRTTTTADATYGPAPMLTPTSGEPEQRIYSTDPTAAAATTDLNAPPAGANAADWGVAEAIREKLTQDPTLAPLGSQLIAEVNNDGAVTLKGVVKTSDEQQRVRDTIAGVPGVKSVNDDQLTVGTFHGGSKLDTLEPTGR
jgi:hypothetical protein